MNPLFGNVRCSLISQRMDGRAVLLGKGDGTFQPTRAYDASGVGASALVVMDFDGDGQADLLILTNIQSRAMAVRLGNSDGTFHAAMPHNSGGRTRLQ